MFYIVYMTHKMNKALLILDFINDIVHPEGKLSWKWYADFIKNNNTISKVNTAISKFRENNLTIIFVKIWFSKWYANQPKTSPLFGKANEFWVLELWTWWTEIYKEINHNKNDIVITKSRVSSFFETNLNRILKKYNIDEIYLTWCSTDLVVESTSRDAHDRDYTVNILEDCCAAANINDHNNSISTMKKISNIIKVKDI